MSRSSVLVIAGPRTDGNEPSQGLCGWATTLYIPISDWPCGSPKWDLAVSKRVLLCRRGWPVCSCHTRLVGLKEWPLETTTCLKRLTPASLVHNWYRTTGILVFLGVWQAVSATREGGPTPDECRRPESLEALLLKDFVWMLPGCVGTRELDR